MKTKTNRIIGLIVLLILGFCLFAVLTGIGFIIALMIMLMSPYAIVSGIVICSIMIMFFLI